VCLVTSLNTSALPVVHGRLFGMGQSQAKQGLHRMRVVLKATLQALGDAPCRSVPALAQRIGVTEADAAMLVVPPAAPVPPARPPAAAPPPAAPSPRSGMRGRHGASSAPRTRLSRGAVIVASKHALP
jgi:hypothetical protein